MKRDDRRGGLPAVVCGQFLKLVAGGHEIMLDSGPHRKPDEPLYWWHRRLIRQSDLGGHHKHALHVLKDYIGDNVSAHVGVDALAADLSVTPRSVRRTLAELGKLKLLVVQHRGDRQTSLRSIDWQELMRHWRQRTPTSFYTDESRTPTSGVGGRQRQGDPDVHVTPP